MPISPDKKTVIVIAGPTAVGKTAIAIEIAQHFHTEIISADSRQCYKELNIGVARPSVEELKLVKHHFIADCSIKEEITAAGFEQYALEKAGELFRNYDVIVMTGGTGLYIKAFCEGLDKIPDIEKNIRTDIINNYKEKGIEWLQKEIQQSDPVFYNKGEMKNPQRMMRALEVKRSTGISIIDFYKKEKTVRDFNIIKIGIELPKEELQKRINNRVDMMIASGLVDEVKSLIAYKNLSALQTVGYKELFDFFDNKISLEKAVDLIKQHTRQYAKRQMTWFKKDKDMQWIDHSDINNLFSVLTRRINN